VASVSRKVHVPKLPATVRTCPVTSSLPYSSLMGWKLPEGRKSTPLKMPSQRGPMSLLA
jgi:hypothetical protein